MKSGIRALLLKKRNSIKLTEKKLKENAIRKRLFSLHDIKKAKNILFYVSFQSEVDTIHCIQRTFKLKKHVVLPLVESKKRELRLYEIKNLSDLRPGYMGIQEPLVKKNREKFLNDIELVIIPGAGFDMEGNRLGYGFGYYDKLLSKSQGHITTIALAFEEQVVPNLPKESHDVQIDKIITEKRVINCTKGKRVHVQGVRSTL